MTVVSSKEFATNQKKYFDMAINEQIYVQQDDNIFHIVCSHSNVREQRISKNNDILNTALTKEQFKAEARKIVDKIYQNA